MKDGGFTFLRNGRRPGHPCVESIRPALPRAYGFVIAFDPCDDHAKGLLREIGGAKIRIMPTHGSEHIQPDCSLKGVVWKISSKICAGAQCPYACPHGRPTLIEMNCRELERKTGRTQ